MDAPAAFAQSMSFPVGATAGQATFSGCLAKLALPIDAVASMLPPGVALAENDGLVHPCLVAFGDQAEGVTFFGGWPIPWGIRYRELLVAVPLRAFAGVNGPQLFVTGMICDFLPAVWNGNVYYGFHKRFASMSGDGADFRVLNDEGMSVFAATMIGRGAGERETLAWIRSAVALPILGKRDDGVVVQSRFDWDFSEAAIDAASITLVVDQDFEELPTTRDLRCETACLVRRMRWGLSWPMPVVIAD